MADRKLVSVITGTWERHDLLMEAIENVRAQTYRPLEHIIVSDGQDHELSGLVHQVNGKLTDLKIFGLPVIEVDVPIRYVQLGINWSSFLQASMSAVPFQVAQWLAQGPYLCWMADDERFEPDHIESLVNLLEETDSDFVYSKCRVWHKGGDPHGGAIIGTDPPTYGNVTNVLYRRELLDYRGFEIHVGSGTDWDQVSKWVEAGARYAMSDRVTISHRADKSGEGEDYRPDRQILRGHIPRE